jgi:hypothetical protein
MVSRGLSPGGKAKFGLADVAVANGTTPGRTRLFTSSTVQHHSCSGSQGLFAKFICVRKALLAYFLS